MPDSNPLYELVGGYYPGDPIPRKRPPYVNRPTPVEFNSDVMVDDYLRALKRDLDKQSISEQAKKLFIKDVERALVVQTQPKRASYDPMRSLELGDEEDVAGVQVKLDINPVSWIKDPEKMLKKTASGFVKDFANWDDLDSYLERNVMWSPLLGGVEGEDIKDKGMARRYERDIAPTFDTPLIDGVENISHVGGRDTVIKPFQVYNTGSKTTKKVVSMDADTTKVILRMDAKQKGTSQALLDAQLDNVVDSVLKDEDMYEAVADSYMNFIKNRRSSGSRNGALNKHVKSSAQAVAFELKQLVDSKNITGKERVAKIETFLKEEKVLRTANALVGSYDLNVFDFDDYHKLGDRAEKEMRAQGKILYGQGIGKGLGAVTSKFEEAVLDKEPAESAVNAWNQIFGVVKNKETGKIVSASTLTKVKNVLEDTDSHYRKLGEVALSDYKRRTQPLRKLIKKMEDFRDDTQGIMQELEKTIDKAPHKKIEKQLRKRFRRVPTPAEIAREMGVSPEELRAMETKLSFVQKRRFELLKGSVDEMKESFSREGIIIGGLEGMNLDFAENVLLDPEFVDMIYEESSVVGGKSALRIMSTTVKTYRRESTYDIAEKLSEDGVIGIAGDYAWNLFRKRLNGSTPAAVLNNKLKKTHYLGLKYVAEYGPGGEYERNGIEFFNKRLAKNKRFLNTQTIDGVTNIGKFKFVGDTSLYLVFDLHKRFVSESGPSSLDRKGFMALLNGHPSDKYQYQTVYQWNYLKQDDAGNRFMLQRAAGLRKWLKKHNNQLGLEFDQYGRVVDTDKNYEILKSLFKKLYDSERDPTLISLVQKYAGRLDKFSQFLNKYQAKLFSKFKFLSPISYMGNVLAEGGAKNLIKALEKSKIFSGLISKIANSKAAQAVYKAISKLFGAVLGTMTGGVGKAVWAIVERLIFVAIQKITKFLKKIGESFRKGDITIISDFVEEGATSIFKTCGVIAGCSSIMFFLIMVPIVAMLTSITPVDPTRMTYGLDDHAGDGGGDGASSVCTIPGVCDVTGVVGCFEFIEQKGKEWPPGTQEIIEKAAENLLGAGHYINRLCEKGTIEVAWNPSVACGRMAGENRIEFGSGNCYQYVDGSQKYFNWLFAHETGHVYHYRKWKFADVLYEARNADCGNSQPTYVGGSGNNLQCSFTMGTSLAGQKEDFAELVGNFVQFINKCDETNATGGDMNVFFNEVGSWNRNCPNAFRGHYDFAIENLFGAP